MAENMTKQELLKEIQKRGRINLGVLPHRASCGSWIYVPKVGTGLITYASTSPTRVFIHIDDMRRYNPPRYERNIPVFSGSKEGMLRAINKLPFITEPICFWIGSFGPQNITKDHAIYLYCLSLGAFKAAEKKYEQLVQLVPKTPKIDTKKVKVTQDLTLGVYFYSAGARVSGNYLTKCNYTDLEISG